MLQLVLNWEVSQAAVKTGMIRGGLHGPKQGQNVAEKEKRVSGAVPVRSEILRTGPQEWGGPLAPEQTFQAWFAEVEAASSPWPGLWAPYPGEASRMRHHLQGIPFGVGAGQEGLEPKGRTGIEVECWGKERGAAGRSRARRPFNSVPIMQLQSRVLGA